MTNIIIFEKSTEKKAGQWFGLGTYAIVLFEPSGQSNPGNPSRFPQLRSETKSDFTLGRTFSPDGSHLRGLRTERMLAPICRTNA